jgi:hypothetical protein
MTKYDYQEKMIKLHMMKYKALVTLFKYGPDVSYRDILNIAELRNEKILDVVTAMEEAEQEIIELTKAASFEPWFDELYNELFKDERAYAEAEIARNEY